MIQKDTAGMNFKSIIDIACGGTHSLALSSSSKVYSWGNGDAGRLGHGTKRSESVPREILALKDVKPKNVYAGDAHSACISAKNNFYTWGKGSYGRLGHGFTNDIFEPQLVEEIENIKIIDAALGSYYTFVITSNRTVYQWGGTEYSLPTPIPEFRHKRIAEIAAGPYHFLALDTKG